MQDERGSVTWSAWIDHGVTSGGARATLALVRTFEQRAHTTSGDDGPRTTYGVLAVLSDGSARALLAGLPYAAASWLRDVLGRRLDGR